MTKIQLKELATSLTTFVFIIIGLSGVMMFFHIFDNYVKELHEILGLAFVVVVFLHVFVNWKSMKNYFSKKVFAICASIVLAISLGFVFSAKSEGTNPKVATINAVLKAPIEKSFSLFANDVETTKTKLETAGIKVGSAKTIEEISKANKTSPFHIIEIIGK